MTSILNSDCPPPRPKASTGFNGNHKLPIVTYRLTCVNDHSGTFRDARTEASRSRTMSRILDLKHSEFQVSSDQIVPVVGFYQWIKFVTIIILAILAIMLSWGIVFGGSRPGHSHYRVKKSCFAGIANASPLLLRTISPLTH